MTNCPRCRRENPANMNFCGECGARLSASCPACGVANPPINKFCGRCGASLASRDPIRRFGSVEAYTPKHLAEKILTSKAALEGERKHVTVLFGDLQGSMELLSHRDPEEARQVLDPVLERMMEAVHRYEGTVNQIMGDGIMALFGAPVAHEDHAVRACYAALRMQESVTKYADDMRRHHGIAIRIRVGVNSGEVVVRSIGNDLHMDYTAIGQTTHLAARMEQLAPPGSTLMTGDTLRLVEGYVEAKSLGPTPVRGLEEPVEVYEVSGPGAARTRLQASAARGLTRFVGREPELQFLRHAFEQVREGRGGQVVAIVGEPGVGKSRLCWEFTHSHRAQDCLILESGSAPYSTGAAYLPIVEILRAYFRIDGWDDARTIREKVSGKLAMLDESLLSTLPVFLTLMDVTVEDIQWQSLAPSQRRQESIDAWGRLLLRESQFQPLCLVFEDLHWTDSETEALLEGLIDRLHSSRILVLISHRPEYSSAWSSKSYYSPLRITSLAPANANELLTALLGEGRDLQALKRILIERTEGNPFFLEEIVRDLVETKVVVSEGGGYRVAKAPPTLRVPATVQAVLAARIDRLPAAERMILQVAAVIGNTLSFQLLQDVTHTPDSELQHILAHLTAAEFFYQTSLFPELEYSFKHALTHEVVYQGLLHEQRRRLHVQVLEAIERLYPERVSEQIESLANHALRGEVWGKAVVYLGQAGRRAAARSALLDARGWFEQALAVLETQPQSQSTLEQGFETRLELRPVLNLLGEVREALKRLGEAEEIAQRLNDERRQGRVYAFVTNVYSLTGELDQALESGNRALAISHRLSDLGLQITTTTYLEHAYYLRGDYAKVVELAAGNLAAVPVDRISEFFGGTSPPSVYDRLWLVMSLAQLGRFDEASTRAAEAIQLAAPMHHAFTLGLAYRAASTLEFLKGDWERARSVIEHWIAVARSGNVVLQLPRAVASLAWILAHFGQSTEALARIEEGEQLLESHALRGLAKNLGWDYYSLGRAYLLLDRLDEAGGLADRVMELSSRHPGFAAHALHLQGDIAIHPDRGDARRGEAHYREALEIAEDRGMRPLVSLCHLGLGKLHRRHTGDSQAAVDHLGTAITMCREMAMRFWLERAEEERRKAF